MLKINNRLQIYTPLPGCAASNIFMEGRSNALYLGIYSLASAMLETRGWQTIFLPSVSPQNWSSGAVKLLSGIVRPLFFHVQRIYFQLLVSFACAFQDLQACMKDWYTLEWSSRWCGTEYTSNRAVALQSQFSLSVLSRLKSGHHICCSTVSIWPVLYRYPAVGSMIISLFDIIGHHFWERYRHNMICPYIFQYAGFHRSILLLPLYTVSDSLTSLHITSRCIRYLLYAWLIGWEGQFLEQLFNLFKSEVNTFAALLLLLQGIWHARNDIPHESKI